jgi:hypothetical protein
MTNPIYTENTALAAAKRQGAKLANAEKRKGAVLHETAVIFHDAVLTQSVVTQTAFVQAVYGGTATSNGTLLKRLAITAVNLKVRADDADVWPFVVQKGTSAAVGDILKGAEDDVQGTLAALKQAAADWRSGKRAEKQTRAARPNDGEKGEKDETGKVTTRKVATLSDVLDALDAYLKVADREEFAAAEDRINAMLHREITLRAKVKDESAA